MKKYLFTTLPVIAGLLLFAGCGSDPVTVVEVQLNKVTATLAVGDTEQLTATVLPADAENKAVAWSSSAAAIASVDNNGLVTAVAEGAATITVTTADGGKTATCAVTVEAAEHPLLGIVSFKTSQTWTVGTQTWSDAVVATGCQKEDFDGGTYGSEDYKVACRKNEGYGDWFSWEAVNQHQDALCPAGWRVPTRDDFIALDIALGGNGENRMMGDGITPQAYLDNWGAQFGGYCWMYNGVLQLSYVGEYGGYWAQTAASASQGASLNLGTAYGYVSPRASADKYNGYTVRCIQE